ncbi:MAG: DNA repair protein RecN [Chlamydiales bacterium]
MLEKLILRNIALIDETEIPFKRGLNILTGETGAGKTAIITALSLLLGERADSKIIRTGAAQATIQGIFSPELLEKFDLPQDDNLIIRREIFATGKSQLFIQDRQSTLSFAKELGRHLIDIVSQHAHLNIRNKQEQLRYLDDFAQNDLNSFSQSFQQEKALQNKLTTHHEQQKEAERKIEQLKWDQEQLQKLDAKENEEDELFEEYKTLSEKQELAEELHPLSTFLAETQLPTITHPEIATHLKNAQHELQEAAFITSQELSRLEFDPARFAYIESRLKALHKAKKRYGDPFATLETISREIESLESLDETLDHIEKKLEEAKEKTDAQAKQLSQSRKKAAKELSEKLTQLIRELNMPGATVILELEKTPRAQTGDEKVHITLQPNPGERAIRIEEGVSGGEISRLYFALSTLITQNTTLLFDEIDANIGGETATLFGEKLRLLGQKTQIISITHFPQVARFADHHLKIHKSTHDCRTQTQITALSSRERQEELLRMLGGSALTI